MLSNPAPLAPAVYKRCMKLCEIYHVSSKGSFAWKWRHRLLDGRVIESKEKYRLYYECVEAALERGYQPDIKCLGADGGAPARAHT